MHAAMYGPLVNKTIPYYLSRFDEIVEEKGGYFVNGKKNGNWRCSILTSKDIVFGHGTVARDYSCRLVIYDCSRAGEKMAPKYKLMYFDIMALAEPIRFLFHYGNIEFEDYRYSMDEWKNILKPTAPFGQGPLLEVDGKRLWQSVAIQRYVAGLVGLGGSDDWERFEVDMMAETLWDLRCLLYLWFTDKTENKGKNQQRVLEQELPYLLKKLDERVQEHKGHFVNGKVTWPDLQYTAMYDYLCRMAGKKIDEEYPNLKKLRLKISETPQIKSWIEKRPRSEW